MHNQFYNGNIGYKSTFMYKLAAGQCPVWVVIYRWMRICTFGIFLVYF